MTRHYISKIWGQWIAANEIYCVTIEILILCMGRRSYATVKLLELGPVCVPRKVSRCLWKVLRPIKHKSDARIRGLVTDERIRRRSPTTPESGTEDNRIEKVHYFLDGGGLATNSMPFWILPLRPEMHFSSSFFS